MSIKKTTMNELVELVTDNQNDIKPLNAGQSREVISIIFKNLDQLTPDALAEISAACSKALAQQVKMML